MESNLIVADNELLGRYLNKSDESAFAEIVNRHSPMVMGVCRNMLLHSQDAEDAFQATFLVLSKKAHRLLDRGSLAGWLYEVAIRNSLEVRRRKGRARESEMVEEVTSNINEPWRTISSAQDRERIHAEIRKLPKRYRDAIVMCHFSGYSRSEAAELLGTTEGSIKAALSRGRNLLRKRLIRFGIITTVLLTLLQDNTAKASEFVTEPLLDATLRLCQGLSPKLNCASPGSTPELIQSLSNAGTQSMNTITIVKSIACAAAVMVAISIPIVIYAQETIEDPTTLTLDVSADANMKGEFNVQESKIDVVRNGIVKNNHPNDLNVEQNGVVGFDGPANNLAELQGDVEIHALQSLNGLQVNGNQQDVEAVEKLVGQLENVHAYTSANQDQEPNPAEFLPQNESAYWELMKKSHMARVVAIKQMSSRDLSNEADMYEYQAKVIEADLNLKRIAAGILVDSTGKTTTNPAESKKTQAYRRQNEARETTVGNPFASNRSRDIESSPDVSGSFDSPGSFEKASTDLVQPGDELTVESLTDAAIQRRVFVTRDYTIRLPFVGVLNVKGMTVDLIQKELNNKYSAYVENPNIFVARANESMPLEENGNLK